MDIVLPWPPSANNLFPTSGNRRKLSSKARDYRTLVSQLLLEQGVTRRFDHDVLLGIDITAWFPDKRRHDLDGLLKAPIDALMFARLYPDDSQFKLITIHKGGTVPDEMIHLTLGDEL